MAKLRSALGALRPSRRTLVRVGAAAAAVVLVVTGVFSYRSCLPGFVFDDGRALAATLRPSDEDALGVAPDASFVLTLEEALPLSVVRRAVTIEPAVEFTVAAADGGGGKVFVIRASEPLEPDRVYRIRLALAGPEEPGYSWAYQVRGDLRVVATLPGNRSSGAPLRTGIELEFSHDGVNDPSEFFTISPSVPGKWERYRRVWVFVPAVPLDPATVYTCTLRAGLGAEGTNQVLREDYVFAFETEPARSGTPAGFYFYLHETGGVQAFAPDQAPFFGVSYYDLGGEAGSGRVPTASTEVYRYSDASALVAALRERDRVPYWAQAAREGYRPDTTGLERVLRADLELRSLGWATYIVLPEPLPEGFYLAVFRLGGVTRLAWFQVTDLAGYVIAAVDETALWFNDLSSAAPVPGVEVSPASGGARLAASGPDGVARFTTPAELVDPASAARPGGGDPASNWESVAPYYVLATSPSGSRLILDLSPRWGREDFERRRTVDSYWVYLHTDRPLYLPDDEVWFWGLVEPLAPGAGQVQELTIELRASPYDVWSGALGGRGDPGLISRQTIRLSPGHTFEGSVRLPNLRPGYYHLKVAVGNVALAWKYFEVATYTKPAYRVDLDADRRAVFAGEKVSFTLTAEFFEGTPVAALRFDYGGSPGHGTLTTGLDGRAVLVHRPAAGGDPSVLERQDTLYVNADLPEAGYIWASAGVRVFEKDVAMRADVRREGQTAWVEVRLNAVTLDRINAPSEGGGVGNGAPRPSGVYGPGWADYLGDPVAGRPVTARLYEQRWIKEEVGQYYDFVNKVVRKTYFYREQREFLEEFVLTTGSDGLAAWSFTPDPGKTYIVTLTSTDNSGRVISREVFAHGQFTAGPDEEWPWYHLEPSDRNQARYSVGEKVDLTVKDRGNPVADRPKAFLFYTARQGLDVVEVSGKAGWSFTFEKGFVPNTNVGGVYFDGREYHELSCLAVRFEYSERGLDVSVTTDRETYRPGDKAVITVAVTDAAGNPVRAEVNLCMVDEALYRLIDQRVAFLDDLYAKHIGTYIFHTAGSHRKRAVPGEGAESGGEGGGERRDFRDTALFKTLTTGSSGRATTEIVLPDNLTSWRITYHAYASGVRAGSGTVSVPVKLPFFVELSLNQTYLAGDEPVLPVRAYGTALTPGTSVTFEGSLVRLPAGGSESVGGAAGGSTGPGGAGGEVAAEFTGRGEAFVPTGLALGQLTAGSYEVRVTGRAAGPDGTPLVDTLVLPITVLDTYLRLDRVDYYRVAADLKVAGAPGELTTLTFSDAERGKYLAMLERLSGGGARADMKAARVAAVRLLVEHFGLDESRLGEAPTASELAAFQASGGVALLPYADPSLELTAKAAALVAAGQGVGFDRNGLLGYLGAVYDDPRATRERLCVALFGLAALGEPVLSELKLLAAAPDLSDKEILYLCLGLTELGDEERARTLFADLLRRRGDRIGPLLRLNVSRDPEETIAATSLGAVVAARLRLTERLAMLDYLLDNAPWEELNLLDMALYLSLAVPRTPSEAVSFVLGPQGTRVTLAPQETYSLTLRSEELAALTFSDIQGNVGLCVRYRAPVDLDQVKVRSNEISLTRSYYVGGRRVTALRAGDLVKVVLEYRVAASAPEGPFQVVDFLPSGLKAVPRPLYVSERDGDVQWPVEVDGQKVTFNLWVERRTDPKTGRVVSREGAGRIAYYARVVSTGTYQADPALVQHVKSGEIFAVTEKDILGIR